MMPSICTRSASCPHRGQDPSKHQGTAVQQHFMGYSVRNHQHFTRKRDSTKCRIGEDKFLSVRWTIMNISSEEHFMNSSSLTGGGVRFADVFGDTRGIGGGIDRYVWPVAHRHIPMCKFTLSHRTLVASWGERRDLWCRGYPELFFH